MRPVDGIESTSLLPQLFQPSFSDRCILVILKLSLKLGEDIFVVLDIAVSAPVVVFGHGVCVRWEQTTIDGSGWMRRLLIVMC